MAEGLAEMGAHLVLCARRKERCAQAAAELQQLGVPTLALVCDVTKPQDVQSGVETTLSQFGRIDTLINNAGVSWGANRMVGESARPPGSFREVQNWKSVKDCEKMRRPARPPVTFS